MSESALEKKCWRWAKLVYGIKTIKLTSTAGWPDRLFIKGSRCFFIEFKSEKGHLRPMQTYIIEELRKDGAEVFIVNNFEHFKQITTDFIEKYEP